MAKPKIPPAGATDPSLASTATSDKKSRFRPRKHPRPPQLSSSSASRSTSSAQPDLGEHPSNDQLIPDDACRGDNVEGVSSEYKRSRTSELDLSTENPPKRFKANHASSKSTKSTSPSSKSDDTDDCGIFKSTSLGETTAETMSQPAIKSPIKSTLIDETTAGTILQPEVKSSIKSKLIDETTAGTISQPDIKSPTTSPPKLQSHGTGEEPEKKQGGLVSDPIFNKLPWEIRNQIFGYCIPDRSLTCWQEKICGGETVLRQAISPMAVSLLQVSSKWFAEAIMMVYKDVYFVVSGQDLEFASPAGELQYKCVDKDDEALETEEGFISTEAIKVLKDRWKAKCTLLIGKSPSEPSFAPYLRYTQNLTILIELGQYHHDSMFINARGVQEHVPPEFGKVTDEFLEQHCYEYIDPSYAEDECRGRAQGRLSANFLAMANACQVLEKYDPKLKTVTFECGSSLRKKACDNLLVNQETTVQPWWPGDKKAHLEESLAPFMISLANLSVDKIVAGPKMRTHLEMIQKWRLDTNHTDPKFPSFFNNYAAPPTLSDDELLDYRFLFPEMKAKADNSPEIGSIQDLGNDLKNLIRSFLPYPHASEPAWCARAANFAYHFHRDVYEDVSSIQYVLDTKPCLASVWCLRRRVYSELGPRYQRLREGYESFMQNRGVVTWGLIWDFFRSFSNEDFFPLYTGNIPVPDNIHDPHRPWDQNIFNRRLAWVNMYNSHSHIGEHDAECRAQYSELVNDLQSQYLKIKELWDFNEAKYGFLDGLGELPQARGIEYDNDTGDEPSPSAELAKAKVLAISKADAELEIDKLNRTLRVDEDVQYLVSQGETSKAWRLLQMLAGDTSNFCKYKLPPKPPATIPVQPIPTKVDRPAMRFYMGAVARTGNGSDGYVMARQKIKKNKRLAGIHMPHKLITRKVWPEFDSGEADWPEFTVEEIMKAKEEAEKRFRDGPALRDAKRRELIAEGYGY